MKDEPGNPTPLDELDNLMATPERWGDIPVPTLHQLVYYQCLSYGIEPEDEAVPRLMALYQVAVTRMHPGARQQLVMHLARAVERVHREQEVTEGAGCTNALLPFLVNDPDPSVVSTAAVEMAALLPLEDDDPMTGPLYVHSVLADLEGEEPRAGLVAGLLQLGDRRVAPLVEGKWRELGAEGRQSLALLILGFHSLHLTTVEFLLAWLEDESSDTAAPGFGTVAATLARAGHHAAEHGVVDAERVFPATAAPPDRPQQHVRRFTRDQVAGRIAPRLAAVASREHPPELMAQVLHEWGLDDQAGGGSRRPEPGQR